MNIDDIRSKFRARVPDVIGDLRAKARDHSTVAREAGYTIRNADTEEAVVRIYDEIWWLGVNALDLAADLDTITAPKIRVEINSPGGDVWDGIAIYNALRSHPATVTTRVDGIAASIASVIAQAGDHRIMLGGSQMMIHNAWGLTVGDHTDHEQQAEVLAHQDAVIAGIYATRAGKSVDEFKALMDAETWLTAEGAVELGLADEVIEPDSKGAKDRLTYTIAAKDPDKATLLDKISMAVSAVDEAVTSAEQVSAIRAEAGKTLTGVNLEGLSGLRAAIGRIDGLLKPEQTDPDLAARKLALAKRENEWRASLPPHLL